MDELEGLNVVDEDADEPLDFADEGDEELAEKDDDDDDSDEDEER